MITKEIIGKNDHLYDALFADISETIKTGTDDNGKDTYIQINTLEDYFMNLETIVDWVERNPNKSYYLRLPADEELFEINANTRTISVPSNYKNHGIAVVGDTFAETLWFKIDRYYDLQDLSLANIKIYWELPSQSKEKNQGYSVPVFIDINSEARQLIFGWVIPDMLTKIAGDLKFTISFSVVSGEGENTKTDYEFNTLAQSVKINKTLSHNAALYDDTDFDSVKNRLHSTSNIGKIFVSRPIFIPQGGYLVTGYENNIISEVGSTITKLISSGGEKPLLIFSAYSDSNGAKISYNAFRCKSESNRNETETIKDAGVYYYRTTDAIKNPNKIYFDSSLSQLSGDFEDGETYYEAYQGYNIFAPGTYQAKATATINSTSSSSEYSGVWTWEYPNEFTDDEIILNSKYGIIGKKDILLNHISPKGDQQKNANYSFKYFAENATEEEGISLVPDSDGNIAFMPNEAGVYTIKVTKELNGAETKNPYFIENIEFQNAATSVAISLPTGASTFIGANSEEKAQLQIANYGSDDHNYIFQWQRKKGPEEWEDVSTLRFENPELNGGRYEQTMPNAGIYRLVIKTTYLEDSVQTISDVEFTVWTIE